MVYHERAAWSGLIAAVATAAGYVILALQAARGGALVEVDWLPLMAWAIGGGVALSIALTILWSIVAGMRDREAATASDIRDRDIGRMAGRVESAFLVIAGIGVIVLCAVEANAFWIANVMFAGFTVAAIVGGIARVIAYRRGLV